VVKLPRLEDSIFEVVRINGRIAEALGRVAVEFLRDVTTTLNDSPLLDLDAARRHRRPRSMRDDADPLRARPPETVWTPPPPPRPAPAPAPAEELDVDLGDPPVQLEPAPKRHWWQRRKQS